MTRLRRLPTPAAVRMTGIYRPEECGHFMSGIGPTATGPELGFRDVAQRLGYDPSTSDADLPGRPGSVFKYRRKVALLHGCSWQVRPGLCPPTLELLEMALTRRGRRMEFLATLDRLSAGVLAGLTQYAASASVPVLRSSVYAAPFRSRTTNREVTNLLVSANGG